MNDTPLYTVKEEIIMSNKDIHYFLFLWINLIEVALWNELIKMVKEENLILNIFIKKMEPSLKKY